MLEAVHMKEIRLHGLGGQGAAKGSEIMTMAFIMDDKYAASFPMYGAARKGGSVSAFCRYDDSPVREKTKIYNPDCIVVFSDSLLGQVEGGRRKIDVFDGLKLGSILVVNSAQGFNVSPNPNVGIIGVVDADTIATEEIGFAAVNTTLLAAFAKATGWLSLDAIKNAYARYFSGSALEKNLRCANRAFEETVILQF